MERFLLIFFNSLKNNYFYLPFNVKKETMKTPRIILLSVLMILTVSQLAWSQKKRIEKADAAFESGEFYDAIDLYKNAYAAIQDKSLKTTVVFKIAECYRLTNESERAELWYKKAIGQHYPDPVAVLHYAESMKKDDKYENAINEFKRYKELVPDDPRGGEGIASCQLATEWIKNPIGYEVINMKYFNSHDRDFSPAYARDDYKVIYFTSSRDDATGNKTHGATGQNFSDIFVTKMDRKGKWSSPVPLNSEINTEFEEGTPSLSADYNTMYFTRCEVSKRKKLGCQIMSSLRTAEGWGKAEPVKILADSLVAAHPALSFDGLSMMFVSDKEGGFGGKDIWKVSRDSPSGDWSEPENLGPEINTEGDELFPYLHKDGTLYFSSDRHLGMGGLDIFRAKKNTDGIWIVENMRYPINSSADDFGIIFENEAERGYFSSSRKGRGNDEIYAFFLPPLKFNVKGLVVNSSTEAAIPEAKVKLIGSDGTTLEDNTSGDGSFKFMLKPSTDYIFLASKPGFLNSKGRETTKGQKKRYGMGFTLG